MLLLRRKKVTQNCTATGKPGLYRPEIHLEDVGDLFVGETFNLAEDDYSPEGLRHLAQSGLDAFTKLLPCRLIEGRAVRVCQGRAQAERVALVVCSVLRVERRLHRDLLLFVALPPAALVGCFVQSNAIQPRPQAGLAMEAPDITEDLNKDFLRDVGSVGGILQAAGDQRVKWLMVLGNQFCKRTFRASLKLGDKGGLFTWNGNGARQISHYVARLHHRVSFNLRVR